MKPTFALLTALLLAPLSAMYAVEPSKQLMLHHGSKLIVVNDDGFSALHSGRYKSAANLGKMMLTYKDTQVAVMEWCGFVDDARTQPASPA
jgi:hypothetical protein